MVLDRQVQSPANSPRTKRARELLIAWLREHNHGVWGKVIGTDWTYWEYSDRPFWSCYLITYHWEASGSWAKLGFHIYANEVVLVSRE